MALSAGLLALEAAIISAHNTADDFNGGFTGWDVSQVFDTTVTVTTPDALRTEVESWKNGSITVKKEILCDWDGPLDITSNTIRGFASSKLTPNAGVFGGYDRPTGGLLIRPATGRTPAFGNTLLVYGMPRIEFRDIGFATQANGGDGDNIRCMQWLITGTFPLPNAIAFNDCKVGLTHWRPSEPFSEYVKGLAGNGSLTLSVHVEGCEFDGVRDQLSVPALFSRVKRNIAKNAISDFTTAFPHTGYAGTEINSIWCESNLTYKMIDDASLSSLHQDFLQTGTAADSHKGYSILGRYNVTHMSAEFSGGSQGFYNDDFLTASNEFAIHDNIVLTTAPQSMVAWNTDVTKDGYFEQNTIMSAARRPVANDFVSGVSVFDLVGAGAWNVLSFSGNIFGDLNDTGALITNASGNQYVNPKKDVVSGDGTTFAQGKRPEDAFVGTFDRDVNDFLTYTVDETGTTAQSYYNIVDRFEPVGGWGVFGASDPEAWPDAPVRPVSPSSGGNGLGGWSIGFHPFFWRP